MEDYVYQTCPRCKCFSSTMYKVPVQHEYILGDYFISERFLKCDKCKSNFINLRSYSKETISWLPSEQKVYDACYVKKLKRPNFLVRKLTVIYLFCPIFSDRIDISQRVEEYIDSRNDLGVITLVDWFTGLDIAPMTESLYDKVQNVIILPQTLFMGSLTTQFPSLWAERAVLSIAKDYPFKVNFVTVYPAITEELDQLEHIKYFEKNNVGQGWSDSDIKYFENKWVNQSNEKEIFVGVSS